MPRICRKKRKNKKRCKPKGSSTQRLPWNESIPQGATSQGQQTKRRSKKAAVDDLSTRIKSRYQQSHFFGDTNTKNKNKILEKKKRHENKQDYDIYEAYQGLGKARRRPGEEMSAIISNCPYTDTDVYKTSVLIEMFNNIPDYKVNNNKESTKQSQTKPEDDKQNKLDNIHNNRKKIKKGKFSNKLTVIKCIGEGGQATVYQVKYRSEIMAAKIAKGDAFTHLIRQEYVLLSILKHPNVLSVHRQLRRGYLMEILPDNLLDYIDRIKPGSISTDFRNTVTAGILRAVSYIHDIGIAHLDLKVQNILLTTGGEPKLADFGMSVPFRSIDGHRVVLKGKRGTLPYMSPELLSPDPKNQMPPIDAWATGVVMYILFTDGFYPFGNLSPKEVLKNQLGGLVTLPPTLSDQIKQDPTHSAYFDLICKLLTLDPGERLTVKDAVQIFENNQRNLSG